MPCAHTYTETEHKRDVKNPTEEAHSESEVGQAEQYHQHVDEERDLGLPVGPEYT